VRGSLLDALDAPGIHLIYLLFSSKAIRMRNAITESSGQIRVIAILTIGCSGLTALYTPISITNITVALAIKSESHDIPEALRVYVVRWVERSGEQIVPSIFLV
jgi:hypothetical protein